ncbi:MAG: hypothetical protein J6M38_08595 [Lentisphaeria bacterium]|nr:hypothetical protein [Lentisphaeria bacterium]
MKKMLCTLLVSPLLLTVAGNAPFAGPYHSDGTAFYLVHPGGPLELEIKLSKSQPGFRGNPVLKMTPSALLTLSDPDEKIVEKKYWRIGKGETEKSYNFRFPNAAPGIWQLRNSFASNGNLSIEFNTKPNLKYGVLFSRCKILKEDLPHLRDSYFLVPPPLPNLPQNPKWYASTSKKQNKLHITNRGGKPNFMTGRDVSPHSAISLKLSEPSPIFTEIPTGNFPTAQRKFSGHPSVPPSP